MGDAFRIFARINLMYFQRRCKFPDDVRLFNLHEQRCHNVPSRAVCDIRSLRNPRHSRKRKAYRRRHEARKPQAVSPEPRSCSHGTSVGPFPNVS